MITYADTDKIKDIAKDIDVLANEYLKEINNMFKRFANVPRGTEEWVGQSADYYYEKISYDKIDFVKFGENIKTYSKKLMSDADSIKSTVKNNVVNEAKK